MSNLNRTKFNFFTPNKTKVIVYKPYGTSKQNLKFLSLFYVKLCTFNGKL